jgi:hypothetical protein
MLLLPQWVRRGADAVRYGLQGLNIIIIDLLLLLLQVGLLRLTPCCCC